MNKIKFSIAILLMLIIGFSEASNSFKEDGLPTSLKITVIDESGNPVENVIVKIYLTKEDYLNSQNQLSELITNKNGVVKFKKLKAISYFVDARKEKLNNDGMDAQTDALKEGKINKVNLEIK